MENERTSSDPVAAPDPASAPDIETLMAVDGVLAIPASGMTITTETVRRMIDEDRDRHLPDLARKR